MRLADIQFSFPYLMVAIFIGAIFQIVFGVGSYERLAVPLLIVIIGLSEWPMYARTIRASVIGEVGKEYVAQLPDICNGDFNHPGSQCRHE